MIFFYIFNYSFYRYHCQSCGELFASCNARIPRLNDDMVEAIVANVSILPPLPGPTIDALPPLIDLCRQKTISK